MIIVTAYHMENSEDEEVKYVRVDEEIICPVCGYALDKVAKNISNQSIYDESTINRIKAW